MSEENTTVVALVPKDDENTPVKIEGDGCLVVFYGQNLGRRYFLKNKSEQIIGRSDSASIHVDQESISRQHAKILTDENRSRLVDLGSTNGTFVNEYKVSDVFLEDGDLVKIGQTIFKYLSGSKVEAKYHEEIYRLTTIDGLTGTFNKRYFLETLERELNRAARYGRGMSLVLFDIDHFKKINDRYGHLAGDYVLRDLAALVNENIRRQDVFARYGGEEFAIILPENTLEGAALVCEKLRSLVEHKQFVFRSEVIAVTISLGIFVYQPVPIDATVDHFIASADAKLYEAKQSGRNRVCY